MILEPLREDVVTTADGRTLGFAEYGDPMGDPVFWFHGTPGARRQLPPETAVEAQARGLRVIGVDRPGTGNSSSYAYETVVEFAPDIEELADGLGLAQFACVGLSGGGPFVLACAHQLPQRVVVGAVLGGVGPTRGQERAPGYTGLFPLSEPFLALAREPLGRVVTALARISRPMASCFYDGYVRFGPETDRAQLRRPEMKAMFLDDLSRAMEGGLEAPVSDLLLFSRPWGFRLEKIQVPIFFWQGEKDLVVPPSHGPHQASLVKNSRFTVVAGEGHFAGFANVGEVLEAVRGEWDKRLELSSVRNGNGMRHN